MSLKALSMFLIGCLVLLAGTPTYSWAQEEEGFRVLFDGSSLEHWRGYQSEEIGKGWKIDGDALQFDGSGGGDIVTKEAFESFELRFEWKVAKAANSGVMYRVTLGDAAPYFSGPEFQILDDAAHADGAGQNTSASALYGLYAPEHKTLRPVGEWNTARIVIHGNHVEHWLNGAQVVTAEFGSEDWNQRVQNSKFKSWEQFGIHAKGHICLQDHGDEVWYRHIRIKTGDEKKSDARKE